MSTQFHGERKAESPGRTPLFVVLLALWALTSVLPGCGADKEEPAAAKKAAAPETPPENQETQSGSGQMEGTIRVIDPKDRPGEEKVTSGEPNPELLEDWPIHGRVVIRAYRGCKNLNPLTVSNPVDVKAVQYHLNCNLLMTHPEEIRAVPWLAESKPVTEDRSQTWTLRKGAAWSDGKPLTATDVAYSWELLSMPEIAGGPGATMWAASGGDEIESVTALDPRRFRVTYKEAASSIDSTQFGLSFPIVPKHFVPKDAAKIIEMRSMPGSGPYVIKDWDPNAAVNFERLDPWWGDEGHAIFKNRYRVREFVLKVVTDNVQIEEQLKRGLLDLSALNSTDSYVRLKGEPWDDQFKKAHYYLSKWSYLGWNCEDPRFKDARVRRAMSYLVPRPEINEQRYHGLSQAVSGPFSFDTPYNDPTIRPHRRNPDKAKKLLAEAGWKDSDGDGRLDKDGQPFAFTMICQSTSNAWAKAVLDLFGESLKQVGIEMTVRYISGAGGALFSEIANGDMQAYIMLWELDILDPDVYNIFHSSQIDKGWNWQNYRNPKIDELVTTFRESDDDTKRIETARKIHDFLDREQPITFLFTNPSCVIWNRRVKNVHAHPLGIRIWDFRVDKK